VRSPLNLTDTDCGILCPGAAVNPPRLIVCRFIREDGNVRVEGFGPSYGEYNQVIGNHGNRLAMGDYAVSPNLLNGHKPGDTFWYRDRNGVIRHGRYEDTSMKSPGVPNRDIIEGWNQPDRGRSGGIHWDSAQINVTNNYTVVGDADHIIRVIKEKSHEVAKSVHNELRSQWERQTVV
jgi:hypothetical protein